MLTCERRDGVVAGFRLDAFRAGRPRFEPTDAPPLDPFAPRPVGKMRTAAIPGGPAA